MIIMIKKIGNPAIAKVPSNAFFAIRNAMPIKEMDIASNNNFLCKLNLAAIGLFCFLRNLLSKYADNPISVSCNTIIVMIK